MARKYGSHTHGHAKHGGFSAHEVAGVDLNRAAAADNGDALG